MADGLKLGDLAAVERRAITTMKRQVVSIGERLVAVRESAKDLAPKIVQQFKDLDAKYPNLGGFIGYTRLFDDTIPLHARTKDGEPGYMVHKTYMALDYMRRLMRATTRQVGTPGRTDPARDTLARLLATLTSVLRDPAPIWAALSREFGMSDRMVARLKTRVAAVQPVVNLRAAIRQPVTITEEAIVHMNREVPAAAEAAPARRRRGAQADEQAAA